MPSYSSALIILAHDVHEVLKTKLKSKKKYQVHNVSIQDTYIRLYITKTGVPAGPFEIHKGVRFIELTQCRADQDKWQVGFGHDLATEEPFKMVGYFHPKKAPSFLNIAKQANVFLTTGEYPLVVRTEQ
jgi:hypothetical protein